MDANNFCPTCGARWAGAKYQSLEGVIVTCADDHRFLVGRLRPASQYLKLVPVDAYSGHSRTKDGAVRQRPASALGPCTAGRA